jgi:hypothetical protein
MLIPDSPQRGCGLHMGRIYCRVAEIEIIAHTICVALISGATKLDEQAIMRLEKMMVCLMMPTAHPTKLPSFPALK